MATSRRHPDRPGRIGSMLVAVGCLGILGVTFGIGFFSGRHWARAPQVAADGDPAPAVAGAPPDRSGARAPTPPALTFYEELTAPLTAPVPPTKAAPPPDVRRPAEKADRAGGRAAEERPARSAEAPPRRSEPGAGAPRFTVQIAAYSARASAEAQRESVSASGHEAYIVETDGPPGAPRYRVRIGSYPSREAALAAASRLPVPGPRYVTTR
jgi:DedD protein